MLKGNSLELIFQPFSSDQQNDDGDHNNADQHCGDQKDDRNSGNSENKNGAIHLGVKAQICVQNWAQIWMLLNVWIN